jgi:hypothetical protein
MKLPTILNYLGFSVIVFCNYNDFSNIDNSDVVKAKPESTVQLEDSNATPVEIQLLHPVDVPENIKQLQDTRIGPDEIPSGNTETESEHHHSQPVSESVSNSSSHSSHQADHNSESEHDHFTHRKIEPKQDHNNLESIQHSNNDPQENNYDKSSDSKLMHKHEEHNELDSSSDNGQDHHFEHDNDQVLDDSRVYHSTSWDSLFSHDSYDQVVLENIPKNVDHYSQILEHAPENIDHQSRTPESHERTYSALAVWWYGLWGIDLYSDSSETTVEQAPISEHAENTENILHEQGNSEESRNILQQAAHDLFDYEKATEDHDKYKGFSPQLADNIFRESHNLEYEDLDSRYGKSHDEDQGGIFTQIYNFIFGTRDKKVVREYQRLVNPITMQPYPPNGQYPYSPQFFIPNQPPMMACPGMYYYPPNQRYYPQQNQASYLPQRQGNYPPSYPTRQNPQQYQPSYPYQNNRGYPTNNPTQQNQPPWSAQNINNYPTQYGQYNSQQYQQSYFSQNSRSYPANSPTQQNQAAWPVQNNNNYPTQYSQYNSHQYRKLEPQSN